MAHAVFSWVNNLSAAVLTTTHPSAPGLPPQNLQNDQGSSASAWRTPGGQSAHLVMDAGSVVVWRALAVARTNLSAAATIHWVLTTDSAGTHVAYDTGEIPANVVPGFGQSVTVLPADVSCQYGQCIINDPTNPDGYISIALAHAGPSWSPLTNFGFDSTFGRDDQVDEATTRGGQEFPVFRYARRRWSVTLAGVRQSEVWPDVMELDRLGRMGGNVLFVPDPASADINREAVYGRFTPSADLSWPYQGADRRQYAAKITERL